MGEAVWVSGEGCAGGTKRGGEAVSEGERQEFFIAFRKRMLWRAGMWAAQKVLGYGAFCGLVVAAGA